MKCDKCKQVPDECICELERRCNRCNALLRHPVHEESRCSKCGCPAFRFVKK